ncbi:hypothetical protein PR202_gb23724 [Eleusine coracana subsp. coracana]|uniref:F-box domain-containing protein n=1 Tax=Eleusine coracana subsp. coracana TaxID=191504 RepID=A0AAV5FJU9_ELECO|nr:hypothetical protein PR202_gb23724 [Eleusine coracana subsp. coracana]
MDCHVDGESTGDRQAADLTARLLKDVLANVLCHLAPRDLTTSRCVCEAWRAMVDARRLLRAKLLPLWLGGIFINFHNYSISELFTCLCDHCNGLLVIEGSDDNSPDLSVHYVLNPATRWCARLPPLSTPVPPSAPTTMEAKPYEYRYDPDPYQDIYDKYLINDPTISLHYKVCGQEITTRLLQRVSQYMLATKVPLPSISDSPSTSSSSPQEPPLEPFGYKDSPLDFHSPLHQNAALTLRTPN